MNPLKILFLLIIPLTSFGQGGGITIDSLIFSKDSLIKIVNSPYHEFINFGNKNLKIFYRNKIAINLKKTNNNCLDDDIKNYGDTAYKELRIGHLVGLPVIASCQKIDSNIYVLVGYNKDYKTTGKFIWILEVKNNNLIISKVIGMPSRRSPDEIAFHVDRKAGSLYFNSSDNRTGQFVYIIGFNFKETYRLLPEPEVIYYFPGIHNGLGNKIEEKSNWIYRIKYK